MSVAPVHLPPLAAFDTKAAACTGGLGWGLVAYMKHRGISGRRVRRRHRKSRRHHPGSGLCEWLAAVIGSLTNICAGLLDIMEWLRREEDVFKVLLYVHGLGAGWRRARYL